MDDSQAYPETNVDSPQLSQALEHLPELDEQELGMLAAGIVAELVNRGNDHETVELVLRDSINAGLEASRTFDQMVEA